MHTPPTNVVANRSAPCSPVAPGFDEVAILYKGDIERMPPALRLAGLFVGIGIRPLLIVGGASEGTVASLADSGIATHDVRVRTSPSQIKFLRLLSWAKYRSRCRAVLSKHSDPGGIVWVCGAETALAMGQALNELRFVLQLNELHDKNWQYLRFLPAVARRASAIVAPTRERAAILRVSLKLPTLPWVLPNNSVPPLESLDSLPETQASRRMAELRHSCSKVILYQGHIDLRERNLIPLLQSSLEWPESWRLVLMGHNHGCLDTCLRLAPKTVYLPFQDPPTHLLVTRLADVGVCCYEFDCLNSIFCAPNKIWEYSACSLPILANDIPGLSAVEQHGAGLCVSFDKPGAITAALECIFNDEQRYRAASGALFASCDMSAALRTILNGLLKGEPRGSTAERGPEEAILRQIDGQPGSDG